MFLCDLDWQLATKQPKLHQSELLSIQWRTFTKQTMAACRHIFLPSPSAILSQGIIFWLMLTLGQFECPNRLHCKIWLLCKLILGLYYLLQNWLNFCKNSMFTYRKYSKQCSPVFNSRHNDDTLLTILLHCTLFAWYSGLPLIRKLKIPWLSLNFKQFSLTF